MTNQIEELKEKIATMQHNLKVLEQLEASRTDVENAYLDAYGHYPETSSFAMGEWDDVSWEAFQKGYEASKNNCEDISRVLIEGDDAYIMGVKYQRVEEPTKPMNEVMNRLEDKYEDVIERMVEELKSKKLYNILKEYNYPYYTVENICNIVEKWLPKEQSAAGSQNVDVEFLVDGFNDCVRKMKEMLR